MNRSKQPSALQPSALRWMIWKDNRQAIPLFIAIAIVVIVVIVAGESGIFRDLQFSGQRSLTIACLLPLLIAAAMPVILISQEREQKTLGWLQTLPLAPKQITLTKFAVCFGWLLVAWLISLIVVPDSMQFLFGSLEPSQRSQSLTMPSSFLYWFAWTLVIFAGSLFAVWQFRSILKVLIAIGVIASAPPLINSGLLANYSYTTDPQSYTHTFYVMLVGAVVLVALAWRSAMRTLGPAPAELKTPNAGTNLTAYSPTMVGQQAPEFHRELPALVWQTIRGSRNSIFLMTAAILLPVVAIYVVTIVNDLSALPSSLTGLIGFSSTLISVMSVCWLGVLVFRRDGSRSAGRFLADRGVAPIKLWLARHAVMLSVLASLLLGYFVISTAIAFLPSRSGDLTSVVPSPAMLVLVGLCLYSVSALVSQCTNAPAMAYILSPIIAVTTLAWLISGYVEFGAPFWLVIAVGIALPFGVTATWMQRYVDGTDWLPRYSLAGLTLLAVILLPLVPGYLKVRGIQTLSSDQRAAYQAEARKSDPAWKNSMAVATTKRERSADIAPIYFDAEWDDDLTADQIKELDAWMADSPMLPEEWFEDWERLKTSGKPFRASFNSTGLLNQLQLNRLLFEQGESSPAFEKWLEAAAVLATGLRKFPHLNEQAMADTYEVWIADALQDPSVKERLSDDVIQSVVQRLPTQSQRNQYRRKAVAASFYPDRTLVSSHLRDMQFSHPQWMPPGWIAWSTRRLDDATVMHLNNAVDNPSSEPWRRFMHMRTGGTSSTFSIGPYGDTLRSLPAIRTIGTNHRTPFRYVGMDWEQQIAKLQEKSK